MAATWPLRAVTLYDFFENPIVLSAISSWFIAQLMKAVIMLLRFHTRGPKELIAVVLWRTGGMPSSHAALVSSMTTSVGFLEGIGSNLFAVTFWFSLIVMRDAMGVRRSSGIQARTLNTLGRSVADKLPIEYHPVKEVYGHAPLEVMVGALLGVFIAAAYTNL